MTNPHQVAFRLMGKKLSCFWCIYCVKKMHTPDEYELQYCTRGYEIRRDDKGCRDFVPIGADREQS
jgi:hypothetical protein